MEIRKISSSNLDINDRAKKDQASHMPLKELQHLKNKSIKARRKAIKRREGKGLLNKIKKIFNTKQDKNAV